MNGTVLSFDAADSLGWIELDDGRRVRFGLTACKRLSPTPGLRVRVTGLRDEGGKLKASEVRSASLLAGLFPPRPRGDAPLDRFDFSTPEARRAHGRAGHLMKWLIINGLVSERLEASAPGPLARVRSGELSGQQFLTEACDERPMRGDLTEEGLGFWQHLYGKPGLFTGLRPSRLEAVLKRAGANEPAILSAIDAEFGAWRRRH